MEDILFDIIIVGGGLVGNSLALALQHSGLKIALIEANTRKQFAESTAGDRALALSAGTASALQRLHVWSGVAEKATPITDIHVSDRGHFGKTRLSALNEQVDALGYVINARDIENHVMELVENSDCRVICPARIVGLASDAECVHVSIRNNQESICLRAKLLVGADGGNSSVRRLLDIPLESNDYNQTALVTTVKTGIPHRNMAYERFTESGPLAFLPVGKNHCAVVWTRRNADAENLMAVSEEDFCAELQSCFGYRLGQLTITAPRRAFPVSLIRSRRMQVGRALIIGNAAHQLHPVAGQGFNLGLRDVIELADRLLQQHDKAGDVGELKFLDGYVRTRQQDHNRTITFTDTLVRMFSTDAVVIAAARNIGLAVFDRLPLAKKILSHHAMGLAQSVINQNKR
jgi:2-octaprenyl-6-methoxyphenol hydroxylase